MTATHHDEYDRPADDVVEDWSQDWSSEIGWPSIGMDQTGRFVRPAGTCAVCIRPSGDDICYLCRQDDNPLGEAW